MNKDFDKVVECFKILNYTPNVDKFEDRIIVQKVIFLLQIKKVEFGYDFNLYLRGPYSPDLTKDMFDQSDKFIENNTSSRKIEEKEIHQIKYLKYIISLDTSLLEVAATFAYFKKIEKEDADEATIKVKKMKHFISENKITKGIYKTEEYLLS